jgi:hypothetical protein
MPHCLSNFCPPIGSPDAYLVAALVESWPEMVDLLSKPVSIAILIAGMLGLIVGWLVRGRETVPVAEPVSLTGLEELHWRHEKLVLTERQQVEKQARLDEFADSAGRHDTPEAMNAALRLFVLAERVREARQKTGTDFSRMQAVGSRLGTIALADGRESEAVKASVRMAALRSATLEEAREALRGISDRILQLEGDAAAGRLDLADADDVLRRKLREIKGSILSLPQGWATSGDETDRQIRELLAMVSMPEVEAVRDVLLIDGAMTLSLSGSGGIDLVGAVTETMVALEKCKLKESVAPFAESFVESDSGLVVELETELVAESGFESDSELIADFESESDTELVADFESELFAESNSESGFESDSELFADFESESDTELVAESGFESDSELVADFESESDTELVVELETELVVELETELVAELETELVAESGFESDSELVADFESESDTELVAESDTELEIELVAESGFESDSELVADFESESNSELVAESNSELVAESDTELVAESDSELVANFESESDTESGFESDSELVAELVVELGSGLVAEPDSELVSIAGGKVNGFSETGKKPPGPALTKIPFIGNTFLEAAVGLPAPGLTQPDTGFRDPGDFTRAPVRIGEDFLDLTTPAPEATLPVAEEPIADVPEENRSLILFCSNNVELWGHDVYRGAHCRARAIKDFPAWAQWISIRRLETRERVFAPVHTASLCNGQTSNPVGFNGTNELFYGARHLGIFSESCPNEVETRFTYGGWGFGHRANEIAPEVEQLQAAGWEGREIPADTVFEIVIHEQLPRLGKLDRLLEPACAELKR